MIPQDLVAEIGRLVREMPRNPIVIAVDEKLKAALSADPVAVTAVTATRSDAMVAATDCLICEARRARQRDKMKRYRNKANANA